MHSRLDADLSTDDLILLQRIFDELCSVLQIQEWECARRARLAASIMRMALSGVTDADAIRRQLL